MRDLATAALGKRYTELLDRSKRRELTSAERSELRGLDVALSTLQSMAAECTS